MTDLEKEATDYATSVLHRIAETEKFQAETGKLKREAWFYPLIVSATVATAVTLFVSALVKLV